MGASAIRARALLRANWRATIALTVLAGITGGFALTAWSAARRGASSFDGFIAAAGEPNALVALCGPTPRGAKADDCPAIDPAATSAAFRRIPGVDAAAAGVLVEGTFALTDGKVSGAIATLMDAGLTSYAGSPPVVAGRRADPKRADEVVLPEEAARLYAIDVGDVVRFVPTLANETPGHETIELRVVGLVRTTADLAAGVDPNARELSDSLPVAGPAFWERYGKGTEAFAMGVVVRTSDRTTRGLDTEVRSRFPGQEYTIEQLRNVANEQNIHDAVRYETAALLAIAVAAGLAWIVFIGQALARQSAREQSDARLVLALGMTRGQRVAAAGLRAAPVAIGAAVIAAATCVLLSPLTPIGRARQAEINVGMRIDGFVVAIGAAALVAASLAFLGGAALLSSHVSPQGIPPSSSLRRHLPLITVAGISFMWAPHRRSLALRAGATTAAAVAVAVAGLGLLDSLHQMTQQPRSYGTSWDAIVVGASPDITVGARLDKLLTAARAEPRVRAVGALEFNTAARIGGRNVSVVGARSVYGPEQPWVVVTKGRAPRGKHEIALGPKTRRRLGLDLGEVTPMEWLGRGNTPEPVTVVGETLFYDGSVMTAGEGAVVDSVRFGPKGRPLGEATVVLRASAALPALRGIERAGLTLVHPPPPPGVRNLQRVDNAPRVIAATVGLLAFAALAHAMVLVGRRERRQLMVLRALGGTRRQLEAALASGGLAVIAAGALIGIPVGLLVQHRIWSALETNIGFSSSWFVSAWPIAAVAAALLLAPLFGALQARIIVRQPPAAALRAE